MAMKKLEWEQVTIHKMQAIYNGTTYGIDEGLIPNMFWASQGGFFIDGYNTIADAKEDCERLASETISGTDN